MTLVNKILAFNFVQSYSNTLTLTNSVYGLISLPQDLFDETVADMRNETNTQLQKQEGWTHDFVNSLEIINFLNFGLGRPAGPGRWFASNIQKLVLLLEYDFVRVEKRPPGVRKVEPCGRSRTVLRERNLKAV